jgi:2-polyprenyl-3-methyl-5-hydroxy-6-metoxy-1,4-benzoquinol methylase
MSNDNWQKRAKTFRQVKYGSPSTEWTQGLQLRLDKVQERIDFKNKKILDVGCGVGMFLKQFKKLGAEVFGVDVDKHKIDIAIKKYENVQVAPAEKLPFKKGTFDIVWLHEVIEHVEDDKKVVSEAMRVLKPRGRLVIFAPNRLWPFETHGIFINDKYQFGNKFLVTYFPDNMYKQMTPHVKNYFKKDLFKLFEGLNCKVVHYQGVFPGFDKLKSRFGIIGKVIYSVFRILEKTILNRFGLSHFVVLEKM